MEEEPPSGSLSLGNVLRPSSVRVSRSFRGSNRSSPRGSASPSFRRLNSARTPRKDDFEKTTLFEWLYWFVRLVRRLPWLLLIVMWIVLVLKIYSRGPVPLDGAINNDGDLRQNLPSTKPVRKNPEDGRSGLSRLARDWIWHRYITPKNRTATRRTLPAPGDSKAPARLDSDKPQGTTYEYTENSSDVNFQRFQALKTGDYFLGRVVGPFGKLEQSLLGTSLLGQEEPSCSQKETRFAEFSRGSRVVLLMHELSMTGSPLAMMELASEIQSCGGKVSVVVLDRRGGLLNELLRRKIPIVADKAGRSWRAAAKAHLVVAGSAVCASWIDNYLKYNRRGASRIVWWIMENRREYYERSKRVLSKVGALIFLSRIQAEQWGEWSRADNITFPSQPSIVSLSVNKDIASVAGISSSQANSTKVLEKLREAARASIGLQPNETLFASLSSINPGKGQLLVLHAAASLLQERASMKLLFGSVGSKSNKQDYVVKMLKFLHHNPTLQKSILWSPASVSVSAIYAAADVYLMNAQGMGETFGRVTIEAMAFGLPVLGTDAGGTKELVESNSTGLLHPVGLKGAANLSQNIIVLMNNPTLGKEMGYRGREKVKSMYTKAFMYEKLAIVFSNCL